MMNRSVMIKIFSVLLLTLMLAGCGNSVVTPPPTELSVQRDRLERQHREIEAALGGPTLQYLSESEYPWTYNPVPKPSFDAWFAEWEGRSVEQHQSFNHFFKQLKNPLYTNIDAKRYRQLERTLRRHLNHLTVYWVTDPANPALVQVVILGKNRFGVFVLSTLSIET
jgi:hypothetical protein